MDTITRYSSSAIAPILLKGLPAEIDNQEQNSKLVDNVLSVIRSSFLLNKYISVFVGECICYIAIPLKL